MDMLKVVALLEYETRVQKILLISLKSCGYMGCVLILSLASRTPSMVWGLMTPDSIPS